MEILSEDVCRRVPDYSATFRAGRGHRLHLGGDVRRTSEILELAGRQLPDDDGAVGALERDTGLLERVGRGGPGRHPEKGGGGGERRGRHGERSWESAGGVPDRTGRGQTARLVPARGRPGALAGRGGQ